MQDYINLPKRGFFIFIFFVYVCGFLTGYLTFLNVNKNINIQNDVILECNPITLNYLNKTHCETNITINNITLNIKSDIDKIIFNGGYT